MATPRFLVPAVLISVGGLGLDMIGNIAPAAYPHAPEWVWLAMFWVSVLFFAALPAWVIGRGLLWLISSWGSFGRLSLNEAAQFAYEALERSGVDDLASTAYSSPSVILEHFKYVFIVAAEEGAVQFYGKRLPSRQSLPIPKDQISGLRPEKETSDLVAQVGAIHVGFTDVHITKRDIRRVISGRIALLKRVEATRVADWKSPQSATKAFSNPDILKARDDAIESMLNSEEKLALAEQKHTDLVKLPAQFWNTEHGESVSRAERVKHAAALKYRIDNEDFQSAQAALFDDIKGKLMSGKLMAKGFRAPHVHGNGEVAIPASEWRLLTLDISKDKAFGAGIEYVGVTISETA